MRNLEYFSFRMKNKLLFVYNLVMITYSCKIKDAEPLIELLKVHRDIVNFASKLHFGCKNSLVELHSKVYKKARKQFNCPSQVVIKAEQECLANYRTTKKNRHKLDSPVEKKNLSLQLDKRVFTFKKGRVSIITLNKRNVFEIETYPIIDELFKKYKFGDPKLFVKDGQVYIAFPFDVPNLIPQNEQVCGVDLGIRRMATTSEGKIFTDKPYLHNKRKIRHKKRTLQAKNTKSAKRKLAKLRRKERLQTRNFVHKLSKQILKSTDCGYVAVEDLSKIKDKKKRGISKYKKINRLSQVPFFMIRQILTYKAPLYGKEVVTVCPSFTSQIDHRTGRQDGERKGCRYLCKDGVVLDADVNASINIAVRSKHPVSSCDGLDGQATVTKLNVFIDKPRNLLRG